MDAGQTAHAVKRFVFAAVACVVLGSAGAYGQEIRAPTRDALEARLEGLLREGDLALLLDYLHAAILAAAEGREPPPPPHALERRVQDFVAEIRVRGTLAAVLALAVLEEQAKALPERLPPPRRPALPPTVPYAPVSSI